MMKIVSSAKQISCRRLFSSFQSLHQSLKQPEVILSRIRNTGIISLNRPSSLNALSMGMMKTLQQHLVKLDSSHRLILMKSANDGAFCAGGDVIAIARNGPDFGMEFVQTVYRVCHLISRLKIPVISLIDGICMGGGLGLAVQSSVRVVSEKAVMSMPETVIGFFPDVGSSYFLPRLPIPNLGLMLSLTAHRVRGRDCVRTGLATHFVPSSRMKSLEQKMIGMRDHSPVAVNQMLSYYCETSDCGEESEMPLLTCLSRDVFSLDSIPAMISKLEEDNSLIARQMAHHLKSVSPYALKVTQRLMRGSSGLTLADCFKQEYRLGFHFFNREDFYRGVDAGESANSKCVCVTDEASSLRKIVLIHKTRDKKWSPNFLEEVSDEMIDSLFKLYTSQPELKLLL